MMKKDFYNKKIPVSKAKNVVDKKAEMRNKIYAYILCGLFVFWTIASVLGIVSFVRTSEKSAGVEMITASAEAMENGVYVGYSYQNLFDISAINTVDESAVDDYTVTVDYLTSSITFKFSSVGEAGDRYHRLGTIREILPSLAYTIEESGVASYVNYFSNKHTSGAVSLYTLSDDGSYSRFVLNSYSSYDYSSATASIHSYNAKVSSALLDTSLYLKYTIANANTVSYVESYMMVISSLPSFSGTYGGYALNGFSSYVKYLFSTNTNCALQVAGGSITEEDLQNAKQEGYNEGYNVGASEGYSNGYTEGETVGKESGYEEGYNVASNLFKSGIFANAEYRVNLTDWITGDGEDFGDVRGTWEVIPENAYIPGGLNVSVLFDYYTAGGGTFETWSLTFKFADPIPLKSFYVGAVGGTAVNIPSIAISAEAVDTSVTLDPYWAESDDGTPYISFMGNSNTSITSITFSLNRRQDSVAFTLYDLNYRNSAIVQDSYNQGYREGSIVGREEGRKDGYADGKAVGYKEGVAAANDYTFDGLLTAVIDVPVQAFTSLFNFEILGVNLANFFLALLSICIVLAVVKLLI